MKINKYLKMTAKVVLTISIVTLTFNLLFSRNLSSNYFHIRVISDSTSMLSGFLDVLQSNFSFNQIPPSRNETLQFRNTTRTPQFTGLNSSGEYEHDGSLDASFKLLGQHLTESHRNTSRYKPKVIVHSSRRYDDVWTTENKTTEYSNKTSSETDKNVCPEKPKDLIGLRLGNYSHVTKSELIEEFTQMEPGGHLRPQNCTPGQSVAIIIPYRNRNSHLLVLLHNLIPFLTRQNVDVTFFVIEQAGNSTFNRGALFNVGFLEAEKFHRFDCYILHDVDIIPLNDHNLYRCGGNPRHFAVALNKYNYNLLYSNYFGGVVGLLRSQYLQVNGNSNLYIGWGAEDDDLLVRVRAKNLTMVRYDVMTARYDMIKHERDEGNAENPLRFALLKSAARRQDVEGLNTVTKHYQVLDIKLETLYTWITVSLDNSGLLEVRSILTAPSYTMNDIKGTKLVMKVK
uniref:Beta-1,4-galactosyltransferase n=1 Tax=Biomphalaria glabrata TaxID=6526 RepID=A0A2C9JI32_BIOGL